MSIKVNCQNELRNLPKKSTFRNMRNEHETEIFSNLEA
jgi:hypothetical protein